MLRRGLFIHARRLFASAAGLPPVSRVKIYEVGARDGLQNEPALLSPQKRIELCERLSRTGVSAVEIAAFVNPKLVPQMEGASEIVQSIHAPGVDLPVLIPNLRGYHAAIAAGAQSVAVMTAASDTFSRNNIRMSVQQSTETALAIVAEAKSSGIATRGYISCCLGCPFEGEVPPSAVAEIAKTLYDGGCDEIVISDTIGTGSPGSMRAVLALTLPHVPVEAIAVHCHDTWGQALANIYCALLHGVSTVDSSVAGLGGCPFAGPGAAGNVATEDVVYMLEGLGIETGVNLDAVASIGEWVVGELGRGNASKAGLAFLRRRQAAACHVREGAPTLSLGGDEGDGEPQQPQGEEESPSNARPKVRAPA